MNIRCAVVDDEPIAQDIIEEYIRNTPGFSLAAKCKNAFEVFSLLKEEPVDVLFLDINMPEMSGITLLKTLLHPPLVVLTTAYSEYALEGFELNAVDYLLKPVSLQRFLQAVQKIHTRINSANKAQALQEIHDGVFFIKQRNELVKVNLDQILYVEGMENYVRIFCEDRELTSLCTMKYIESALPSKDFLRIHRSFIVNLDKVQAVVGNSFKIGKTYLSIGNSYKTRVHEILRNKSL